jgi:hypothetical protein
MTTALAIPNPRPNPLHRRAVAHVTRNPIKYGIAVAAFLAGLWWVRRRRRAAAFAGDLGATDLQTLGRAAHQQVVAAKARKPLSDYRQAEDSRLFWAAPADVAAAHYKAAYWLAVAGRCAQAWQLADFADAEQVAARGAAVNPSTNVTAISEILKSAGQAILTAAPRNAGAKAAAAALGSLSDPGKIATVQQAKRDASTVGIIKGTIKGSANDVADYTQKIVDTAGGMADWARLLIGMDPPGGAPDDPWRDWKKWALRAAVGGVVLIGARWYFAPEYHAAKSALNGAIARGKAIRQAGAES